MAEKLKDILFPESQVRNFANALKSVYPPFRTEDFITEVCDNQWKEKELKQKMRHTSVCLHNYLPDNYEEALDILKKVALKVTGFEAIVLPDYVEVYGQENFDLSIAALGELTKCGSSEFAIRPFLIKNLHKTMQYMYQWADDPDFKVRRFSSEGCRPMLPWAMGVPSLKKDPSPILPILEKLKNDPEEFVRKSVANNLNDISKNHPELVLDICEKWIGTSKNTNWIVKHACRTLLKQGNKRAMLLFGFANPAKMIISNLDVSNKNPKIGDEIFINFDLLLNTAKKQKIRIEYIIHYMKANGKTSPKVFQIKEIEANPGIHPVKKKHSFANMSTRKHYPGFHKIEIIINGESKGILEIDLKNKCCAPKL